MEDTTEEIFCDLMELPPSERGRAIDAMTNLSNESKVIILNMLQEAEHADAYFSKTSVVGKMLPSPSPIEGEGDQCGPYKLVRRLGEGGFGLVWLAAQETPLKRTVAVKVIKAGMDTAEVLARFDAEKHALARMDHPNIAKVLDAGVTDLGRPFFVMELVEGPFITRYCQENEVGLHERLRLFSSVCSAVSHAHQKGVIHRDIKPSNVIVSQLESRPMVKVIDFGIAKAIEGPLTDHSLQTSAEQWIGTPAYMSPEQAGSGNKDVDTRSDIYGLGVLLYELITGHPPFDSKTLMKAGHEEMRRIIREEEPPKPSLRLATTSRNATRQTSRTSIVKSRTARAASSELDWIVMKAMEKAKERRYESAAALSADVARYLANEPIEAKPPSALYAVTKFTRRHRLSLVIGSAFIGLVIISAILSLRFAWRAREAESVAQERLTAALVDRNEKNQALEEAESVTRLLSEVFRRSDPELDGRKITVVDALDNASVKLASELHDQPERHAMLLDVLAETYEKLGVMEKAIGSRRKSLSLLKSCGERALPDSLKSSDILSSRLSHIGEYAQAKDLDIEAFSVREKLHGLAHEQTIKSLESLALNTFRTGEYSHAIDLQEKLVRHLTTVMVAGDPRLDEAKERLLSFCRDSGDIEKALKFSREFPCRIRPSRRERKKKSNLTTGEMDSLILKTQQKISQLEKQHGPKNSKVIEARADLSSHLIQAGRGHEAVDLRIQIAQETSDFYGGTHPKTLHAIEQCMHVANVTERWGVALEMREKAAKIRELTLGQEYYQSLHFHGSRVFFLSLNKRAQEGIELAEKHLPEIRKVMGPQSRSYMHYRCNYARCLASAGRSHDAIEVLAESCPNMLDDTYVNLLYAGLLVWHGRTDDYRTICSRLVEYAKVHRHLHKIHSYQLDKNILICSLLPLESEQQVREVSTTIRHAEKILDSAEYQVPRYYPPWWSKTVQGIGNYRIGDFTMAVQRFDEAEMMLEAEGKNHPNAWHHQMRILYRAMTLHDMGQTDEARRIFMENKDRIRLCDDPAEPLRGKTLPDGIEVSLFLAYKEALRIFGDDEETSQPGS